METTGSGAGTPESGTGAPPPDRREATRNTEWEERLIGPLRLVSVVEATSYLILLAATVVERTGGTGVGVTIVGPIHGVLYLVFAGLVLLARPALDWSIVRTVLALIIGSLPFGGFWLERTWLRPAPPMVAGAADGGG